MRNIFTELNNLKKRLNLTEEEKSRLIKSNVYELFDWIEPSDLKVDKNAKNDAVENWSPQERAERLLHYRRILDE